MPAARELLSLVLDPWPGACGGPANPHPAAPLQNLHQVEIADRVFLEALHHRFEHLERFFLVLDQRIVLAVAAQADALFQVVHAEQMIFPLRSITLSMIMRS
jgi:hypothetical protein